MWPKFVRGSSLFHFLMYIVDSDSCHKEIKKQNLLHENLIDFTKEEVDMEKAMKRLLLLIPTALLSYIGMTCAHVPSYFRYTPPASHEQPRASYEKSQKPPGPVKKEVFQNSASLAQAPKTESSKNYQILFPAPASTLKLPKLQMHNVPLPKYTRGIYLTNNSSRSKERLAWFIKQAQKYNINTFVMDVQGKMVPVELVKMVKKAGIFPVARVVIFEGGLKTKDVPKGYTEAILGTMTAAAQAGFQEIQLDYIRYADRKYLEQLPLAYKYGVINSILKRTHQKARSLNVYLSADIFGRITLNHNDHIGQKLENFAKYMDTIYPMVYPSHYTNDPYRISHPYETIKEGVQKSLRRSKETRIVPYIQGFRMKVKNSGLSLTQYIHAQMKASADARGHGWVVWNAKNQYKETFEAIRLLDAKTPVVAGSLPEEKIEHERPVKAEVDLPETIEKEQAKESPAPIEAPTEESTQAAASSDTEEELKVAPSDQEQPETPEALDSAQEPKAQ